MAETLKPKSVVIFDINQDTFKVTVTYEIEIFGEIIVCPCTSEHPITQKTDYEIIFKDYLLSDNFGQK